MNTRLRITALVTFALAVVVVAAVLVAWLLIDTGRVRERLVASLDEALGMDVQIGEPLRFGLLRGPNVTLEDLTLSREEQVVATAESLRVRFALLSLLGGEADPLELHIEGPELSVDRVIPAMFANDDSETDTAESDDLSLGRLRVSDARLSYADQDTESEWLFEDCDIDLRNIRHGGGMPAQALATVAAEGDLSCRTVGRDRFGVQDLSVQVDGEHGTFELAPISAIIFDGQVTGRIEADLSSSPPEFRVEGSLSGMDIGAFVAALEPDQAAAGEVDFELALNAKGRVWRELRQGAAGMFSLRSEELTVDGYDLDEELENYAETQRFNLIDVGAVFLAGPVGLAASRGYAFTGLLQGSEGSTTIDRMVSEWSVQSGVARARDVAFRTAENRLALSGALDFSEYRFDDLRVAVLDREGCAVVDQRITGPFDDPEVKQPSFLVTVAGPMLELVERGVEAITDRDCETFYSGSIAHP